MVETVMFFKNVHIGITHFVIFNHLHVMMMMMMMMMMLLKMKMKLLTAKIKCARNQRTATMFFYAVSSQIGLPRLISNGKGEDAVTAGCQIHRTKSMANLN